MSKRTLKDFSDHPVKFSRALEKGMFRAKCSHVVDGDTADFLIDLGWYHYSYLPIRFKDIDTPELRGVSIAEKELAKKAKAYVEELILGKSVLIKTTKDKVSFGRFIGEIWFQIEDSTDIKSVIDIELDKDSSGEFVPMSEVLKRDGFEKKKSKD